MVNSESLNIERCGNCDHDIMANGDLVKQELGDKLFGDSLLKEDE